MVFVISGKTLLFPILQIYFAARLWYIYYLVVQRWLFQDGVCDSADSSLRDFSAICVKEFLDWSMKQTVSENIFQWDIYDKFMKYIRKYSSM